MSPMNWSRAVLVESNDGEIVVSRRARADVRSVRPARRPHELRPVPCAVRRDLRRRRAGRSVMAGNEPEAREDFPPEPKFWMQCAAVDNHASPNQARRAVTGGEGQLADGPVRICGALTVRRGGARRALIAVLHARGRVGNPKVPYARVVGIATMPCRVLMPGERSDG